MQYVILPAYELLSEIRSLIRETQSRNISELTFDYFYLLWQGVVFAEGLSEYATKKDHARAMDTLINSLYEEFSERVDFFRTLLGDGTDACTERHWIRCQVLGEELYHLLNAYDVLSLDLSLCSIECIDETTITFIQHSEKNNGYFWP